MAENTRSREDVYLIGNYVEDIKGSKLPSNHQALGYFLRLHHKENKTVREAANETIDKIEEFWKRAFIPVHYKQHSVKKLETLFMQWKGLKKNSSRKTETQKKNEEQFTECFNDLFDIAHANAMDLMNIQEDKDFLMAQRKKGRQGAMSSVDNVHLKKTKNLEARKSKHKQFCQKARQEAESLKETVALESSSDSSAEQEQGEPIPGPSYQTPPVKRGRKKVLTPGLTASLDRSQVSDRSAVMIIGETIRSLSEDVGPIVLNRSSIRRSRQKNRQEIASDIQHNFNPDDALIVHWDGKLIEDLTGQEKVDRLPIIVTSIGGAVQLLSVPRISAGTGQVQAQAVYAALTEWKLQDRVAGMCFDTTSANTGPKMGACVLLEHLLQRDILHLACRHHILELVAGAAFAELVGASSSPEILIFKRFRAQWKFLDTAQYEDCSTDEMVNEAVADVKQDMVNFLNTALEKMQPRDDYRELLELVLIFLGAEPSRGRHFAAPGAMHQARWMAKVIYTFKVWMFRSQFRLTAREQKALRDLCIFYARIYVKA